MSDERVPTVTYTDESVVQIRTEDGVSVRIDCGEGTVVNGYLRLVVNGKTYGIFEGERRPMVHMQGPGDAFRHMEINGGEKPEYKVVNEETGEEVGS